MSDLWVNIVVVLIFIIIGGVFAAAEIALVSLREGQVAQLAKRGRRGRALEKLNANPNQFLAAVQVGVTVAGFASAGFGAAQIAPQLAPLFVGWGMDDGWASTLAFILVTLAIAYVSLVLGELVPKRLGLQRAESVSLFMARPLMFFSKLMRPVITLLSVSTNVMVRVFGGNPEMSKEQITGEELRGMVAAHAELTVEERELIEEVFDAGQREIKEVMIPRTDVDFLEASLSVSDSLEQILNGPHSRYPVISKSADTVIGFVHVRDLMANNGNGRTIGGLARPIVSWPGTKPLFPALTEMRRLGQHMAIVADEYGGTAGIVTMEDLVEELIGDIQDEYDEPEAPSGDRLLIDARLNLSDFEDEFGIELPDGPYETVAGFMLARIGRLPEVGDRVEFEGATLTVAAVEGRRIASISIIPAPEPEYRETDQ